MNPSVSPQLSRVTLRASARGILTPHRFSLSAAGHFIYGRNERFVMPHVVTIIVNYRSAELTLNAVRSLHAARSTLTSLHVYVVENASGDGERLAAAFADDEFNNWVTLIQSPVNGGFAHGNNQALRASFAASPRADFIFLLNPDAAVRPNALEKMVQFLEANSNVAIVGPKLENADGSDWNWAFRFPNILGELDRGLRLGVVSKLLSPYLGSRPVGDVVEPVDWLPGAALLIRREVFEQVGLMDESYFLYYEETDFLLNAARAGLQCWYFPESRVIHIAGYSTGVTSRGVKAKRLPSYWFESRRRFFIKNFGLPYAIAADVAYLSGTALFKVRMRISRRTDETTPYLLRDLLQHFCLRPKFHKISEPINH